MKIAVATNDGDFVDERFNSSSSFKIYSIKNNQIIDVELRQREEAGCCSTQKSEDSHSGKHSCGCGSGGQGHHEKVASEIADCHALIVGGIGKNTYAGLKNAGIDVIFTNYSWTEEAITAYVEYEANRVNEAQIN